MFQDFYSNHVKRVCGFSKKTKTVIAFIDILINSMSSFLFNSEKRVWRWWEQEHLLGGPWALSMQNWKTSKPSTNYAGNRELLPLCARLIKTKELDLTRGWGSTPGCNRTGNRGQPRSWKALLYARPTRASAAHRPPPCSDSDMAGFYTSVRRTHCVFSHTPDEIVGLGLGNGITRKTFICKYRNHTESS